MDPATVDGRPVGKEISMNELFSMGVLIPLWIPGAGLAMGIVLMMKAPAPLEHRDHSHAHAAGHSSAGERTVAPRQTV